MSTHEQKALQLAKWHEAMASEPKRNEAKKQKHQATAAELRRLAGVEAERDALRAELERIKALEPVAWMVYAGLLNMRPIYPAYNTKSTAEFAASQIKSVTAVRPLFDLTQPKESK